MFDELSKLMEILRFNSTVKLPLKIDKTKISMTNGSLLKVESIADF